MKYYTGVGSRSTPREVLEIMFKIGQRLAYEGWTLRTGGAAGADLAFENGCARYRGRAHVYLARPSGARVSGKIMRTNYKDTGLASHFRAEAAKFHPAWARCSPIAKDLHSRNVPQVLGHKLVDGQWVREPSKFLVCWTPDGAEKRTSRQTGGTGQAIRIACGYSVPVFNLYYPDRLQAIKDLVGIQ